VITKNSTLTDVAFAVCTALHQTGAVAVLTGGSAATYYAPHAYQSRDLDFVITMRGSNSASALDALGFKLKSNFYVHAASPFTLDFPPGPLAIGDEEVTTWATVTRGNERLFVLHPLDSCRDRLASLLFWNDFSGLDQALAVHRARRAEIDLEDLRAWAQRERQLKKFELYEELFDRSE
jgi:hypothetical protein